MAPAASATAHVPPTRRSLGDEAARNGLDFDVLLRPPPSSSSSSSRCSWRRRASTGRTASYAVELKSGDASARPAAVLLRRRLVLVLVQVAQPEERRRRRGGTRSKTHLPRPHHPLLRPHPQVVAVRWARASRCVRRSARRRTWRHSHYTNSSGCRRRRTTQACRTRREQGVHMAFLNDEGGGGRHRRPLAWASPELLPISPRKLACDGLLTRLS